MSCVVQHLLSWTIYFAPPGLPKGEVNILFSQLVSRTASDENRTEQCMIVRWQGHPDFAEDRTAGSHSGAKSSGPGSVRFAGQKPGAVKKPFC
jgi:hypothetical protein